MQELDDLKREVAETKAAVDGVIAEVAGVATRVAVIVDQLKTGPSAADLASLAADLDAEQTRLTAVNQALEQIAPPAAPAG